MALARSSTGPSAPAFEAAEKAQSPAEGRDRIRDFYFAILKLPTFVPVALLIGVESALSAAELVLMLQLGERLATGEAIIATGLALVVVALIKLLFSGGVSFFRELWRAEVVDFVLSRAAGNLAGRPDIYPDHNLRRELPQAALTTGYLASENVCGYVVETGRQSAQYLAVFASTILFAGWLLGAALGLSLVVSLVIVRFTNTRLTALSEREELRRLNVGNLFTELWNRAVPGNTQDVRRWWSSYHRAFLAYRGRNRASAMFSYAVQVSHIFATYCLFCGALIYTLLQDNAPVEQGALVVAIPKFIQVMYLQSTLAAYLTAFGVLRGQYAVLSKAIRSPERRDLEDRITPCDIEIDPLGKGQAAVLKLRQNLDGGTNPRRYRVTGRNGAGKTSLLLQLKQQIGDGAYFLPANSEGFASSSGRQSTGQERIAVLQRLLKEQCAEILLLDEWDAHLDPAHKLLGEQLIERAVARGCNVVEVRHLDDVGDGN